MNANEYQRWCRRFDNHEEDSRRQALALGLCAEAGEVANHFERFARKGQQVLGFGLIAHELGDVLWNVARLADELGYTLEDLFQMNINKLIKRYEERGLPLRGDA